MSQEKIYKKLPELKVLEDVIERLRPHAEIETLTKISYKDKEFPLYAISMGSKDLSAPCLLVVGGVHGLERIGTQVINSMLLSIAGSLSWDEAFKENLINYRMIFVPLLNPVGMYRMSRSNGNDVDLMRNSPTESAKPTHKLYSGHRYSNKLPFFRGNKEAMEAENEALFKLVREKVFPAKVSIALDCHSGFGSRDRLWFPYAHTADPCPLIPEIHALKELFDESYQHHVYRIEPQADQYTTHGDIWDYFFAEHEKLNTGGIFLPLCLEMGSWLWIRKNPFQVFNPLGIFNPLSPHREKRMLRRHKNLIDFLRRVIMSPKKWSQLSPEDRKMHEQKALDKWYGGKR